MVITGTRTLALLTLILSLALPPSAQAGEFTDSFDEFGQEFISSCAQLLTKVGIKVGARLEKISREDEARYRRAVQTRQPLVELNTQSDLALGLYDRIRGFVLSTMLIEGRTYRDYVFELFKGGDKLYAFDGKLIRFRPGTDKFVVIPRTLEHFVAVDLRDMDFRRKIRESYNVEHVYPRYPDLKEFNELLTDSDAQWTQDGDSFTYSAAVGYYRLQNSFAEFTIKFTPTETLISFRARRHQGVTEASYLYDQRVLTGKLKEHGYTTEMRFDSGAQTIEVLRGFRRLNPINFGRSGW